MRHERLQRLPVSKRLKVWRKAANYSKKRNEIAKLRENVLACSAVIIFGTNAFLSLRTVSDCMRQQATQQMNG